ncbi:MAG: hypothetical protein AAFV43_08485 [Planctomycetota bacterium]
MLTPILAVGVAVAASAALLAGADAAMIAAWGLAIAVGLYVVAEGLSHLLGIDQPLPRMLFTMLVRGGGAMAAVLIAIAGLGLEPKLVSLIALPIYLSLIASEALAATRLSGDSSAMPATATTEAF